MIKECWNLIGRELFLAITWEPDFSQACSFCRMLINHKNFHFTQIPGKTNDMIFLKSPKTMHLAIFDFFFFFFFFFFYQLGFFSENSGSATHNLDRPQTPCSVSEKANELVLKKLADRCTERQTVPIL